MSTITTSQIKDLVVSDKVTQEMVYALLSGQMEMKKNLHPIVDTDVTTLQIGNRTYEVFSIMKTGEEGCIGGKVLLERAKEMSAMYGEYDANYFVEHQEDIPEKFKRSWFVFPGCVTSSSGTKYVTTVRGSNQGYRKSGYLLCDYWCNRSYFVRPK